MFLYLYNALFFSRTTRKYVQNKQYSTTMDFTIVQISKNLRQQQQQQQQ